MHLTSWIEGVLDKLCHPVDVALGITPTTTAVGVPKVRAVEYINQLEEHPRGPFTGSIGVVAGNNYADFAVVIRSFYVEGGIGYLWAGVVMESTPQAEYYETEVKMAPIKRALSFKLSQGSLNLGGPTRN